MENSNINKQAANLSHKALFKVLKTFTVVTLLFFLYCLVSGGEINVLGVLMVGFIFTFIGLILWALFTGRLNSTQDSDENNNVVSLERRMRTSPVYSDLINNKWYSPFDN